MLRPGLTRRDVSWFERDKVVRQNLWQRLYPAGAFVGLDIKRGSSVTVILNLNLVLFTVTTMLYAWRTWDSSSDFSMLI
jgi:hypothetical protein